MLSIFLGDELNAVVDSIIHDTHYTDAEKKMLKVGVDVLPAIRQDNTDRNRTSPMAFTGNKFEFRMPGSSLSVSGPNIALNTIMAEELEQFADELEQAEDFQSALHQLVKKTLTEHQRILFNGNGYDDAWLLEAEKRGLCNLKSAADALPAYIAPKNIRLFVKHGIYTEAEVRARYEIHVENYTAVVSIEAKTMIDMIRHDILPAVSKYTAELARRAAGKADAGLPCQYESVTAREAAELTDRLMEQCRVLINDLEDMPAGPEEAMRYCHDTLLPDMAQARNSADALEVLTAAEYWPMPVYSQLLFSV